MQTHWPFPLLNRFSFLLSYCFCNQIKIIKSYTSCRWGVRLEMGLFPLTVEKTGHWYAWCWLQEYKTRRTLHFWFGIYFFFHTQLISKVNCIKEKCVYKNGTHFHLAFIFSEWIPLKMKYIIETEIIYLLLIKIYHAQDVECWTT